MARIAKRTKRYPSDLTDEEWAAVAPLLPRTEATGSPRRTDLREILDARRCLVRSGCEWRMLPIHVPPWPTAYGWFRPLARRLLFRTIHDIAPMIDRSRTGRDPEPTAAVLDFTLEIIRRTDAAFEILPRRWVGERTFAGMIPHRRLVRHYEARIDLDQAMTHIAMRWPAKRVGVSLAAHGTAAGAGGRQPSEECGRRVLSC